MAKKYKAGDVIRMRVMEVMDDGVKAMCDHGMHGDGTKEMKENVSSRYRDAMTGQVGMGGDAGY
jgi:hypothetical protein